MPSFIYEYRCITCQVTFVTREHGDWVEHPDCGGTGKRVWSFTYHRGFQEHFNPTVNQPVSSMRQFKSALQRKGEEYSKYTGLDTNFQPVDHDDVKALGITGEGLDATNELRVSKGQKPVLPNG